MISSMKTKSFFMTILRQRHIDNSTSYVATSVLSVLKNVFYEHAENSFSENLNIGNDSVVVKKFEAFENSDHDYFGIRIFTNRKGNAPLYIAFDFLEQLNTFIVVQGSQGRLLPTPSLEQFINQLLYSFQVKKNDDCAYYVSIRKYDNLNRNLDYHNTIIKLTSFVEEELIHGYKQLRMFDFDEQVDDVQNSELIGKTRYSEDVYNHFEINTDLLTIYSNKITKIYTSLSTIVPKELVQFTKLTISQAIVCELISAAICHRMNWDFLRSVILNKTLNHPNWIEAINLSVIQTNEIREIFDGYTKTDRIQPEERAELLRILGTTFVGLPRGFNDIFFKDDGKSQDTQYIIKHLKSCTVFSNDPVEKKLQLLLQKLSVYKGFESVGYTCNPTIDYHLIRSFLRRGFLVPKTKYARKIIFSDAIRSEQTVGAIRKHCSEIIILLSKITGQSIATVNNIEWWIGRSICTEGQPLCETKTSEMEWLSTIYATCPFRNLFCKFEFNAIGTEVFTSLNYRGDSY